MKPKTEETYNLLVKNFPNLFAPLGKTRKINPKEFEPKPKLEPEILTFTVSLKGNETFDEVLSGLPTGVHSIEVTYNPGGKEEFDWEYDPEMGEEVQVSYTTEKRITIYYQTSNPKHRGSVREIACHEQEKKNATQQNIGVREHNREVEENNSELIEKARRDHSQYWRAASRAISTGNNDLKKLVRAELQRRLDELN